MMKFVRYVALSISILIIMAGMVSFAYENAKIREIRAFDDAAFRRMLYTDQELSLFCDVAFMHEDTRVRKWTKDIRVEIKNISEISTEAIAEVDSVIAILAPLIAPLKMERVLSDGNLLVYRKVKEVKSRKIKNKPKHICINGIALLGGRSAYSWGIDFAYIYDRHDAEPQTLMHEFEHALGLAHPINLYPFYLTIGRSAIPQYLRSQKEIQDFMSQPFYLSEQEKSVIRMLYSPEVRAGLHIETFARRMNFDDVERKLRIPDINKDPVIIIYPSPSQKKNIRA